MSDKEVRERTPAEIEAEVEKAKAEAEKAKAEARKAEAETLKIEHEAEEARIEAEEADYALQKVRMNHEREQEKRARELADNVYHHIYLFDEQVSMSSVTTCIKELNYWHRTDPKCAIEIIFFSPGGEVISGMNLFDFIQGLRRKGHKVTTTCMGYAASMAGILLQAGDVRQMGQESYVLIHEVSAAAFGSMGKIEDEVAFLKKIQNRILDIFADRCKKSKAVKPLTKAALRRNWRRKDWWLDSTECLKFGLVDKVV